MAISLDKEKLLRQLLSLRTPLCTLLAIICVYNVANAIFYRVAKPAFTPTLLNLSRPAISQRWAWFNTPTQKTVSAPVQAEVKEARINAKLLGIIARSSGSIAIIDLGRASETSVFREGDALTRSIRVVKIETNRVLIDEQGAVRSLTMAEKRSDDISLAEASFSETNDDDGRDFPVLAGLSFIQTDDGNTGLSLGTISPQILSGTPLEAGDVVLTADGNSVSDIIADPNSFQELLRRDNIDIVIVRDGSEQTVSINPRAMAPNVMRMMANQNR